MIAERFEAEARARIVWGDSREDVIAHLKREGATEKEAQRAYEAVKDCRADYVRAASKEGIFFGIGMLLVPVIPIVIFALLPVKPFKLMLLFAGAGVMGLIGVWKIVRGIVGLVRPQTIQGDLSDEDTD
jgi:hypothetical protein